MPEVRIAAEPRTEFGKGAARHTRRQGRVPAIIYGTVWTPSTSPCPATTEPGALRNEPLRRD